MMNQYSEANEIETQAAKRATRAGQGVSAWEWFLKPEEAERLKFLAKHGAGTWGHEIIKA